MNQLLYYDKKKYLKVCLIGTIVGLLFALNTIFNASSTFSITIGHFYYTEPLPGSSIFAYLIYVIVVMFFLEELLMAFIVFLNGGKRGKNNQNYLYNIFWSYDFDKCFVWNDNAYTVDYI